MKFIYSCFDVLFCKVKDRFLFSSSPRENLFGESTLDETEVRASSFVALHNIVWSTAHWNLTWLPLWRPDCLFLVWQVRSYDTIGVAMTTMASLCHQATDICSPISLLFHPLACQVCRYAFIPVWISMSSGAPYQKEIFFRNSVTMFLLPRYNLHFFSVKYQISQKGQTVIRQYNM